jgi:hypothetical protein
MIEQRSPDGAGYARFSDDGTHRYLIGRMVSTRALEPMVMRVPDDVIEPIRKMVFVMLNPSDANAWKPDPTWTKVCTIARNHGCDIAEAVNLYSLVSSLPKVLWTYPIGLRGDDTFNDNIILEACGAHLSAEERSRIKVVCGWGRHGARDDRGSIVTKMLRDHGIVTHKIDMPLTENEQPMHPLARGRHHVPETVKVVPWC